MRRERRTVEAAVADEQHHAAQLNATSGGTTKQRAQSGGRHGVEGSETRARA